MRSSRKLSWVWALSLILFVVATVATVQEWRGVAAAESGEMAPAGGDVQINNISMIVDTTATMQPELDALAGVWDDTDIVHLNTQYHLLEYKDTPSYLGSTDNPIQMRNWLNALIAEGGGDCQDAALRALASVARNIPDNRALLLSDAAPGGNRAQLAFIINKLVQRGVNVYPVISDWCDDSTLTRSSMLTLARLTGGLPYNVTETEVATATAAALNAMSRADSLLVDNDEVNGIQTYDLVVDSTATTLGVDEEECSPVWCLTCPRPIRDDAALIMTALAVQIRDPEGDILQPGDPGVTVLETSGGMSYRIDVSQVYTPTPSPTATWQIQVQGTGGYVMSAFADSALHFEYLSRHLLPADKPVPFRVRLATDDGAPAVQEEGLRFGLMSPNGNILDEIDLFNDGEHGDGEAGDAVWGGFVTVPKGIWYVVTDGTLADGSPFRRVDPTPLRAKGFGMTGPGARNVLPGTAGTRSFHLTNDGTMTQTYELHLASSQGWAITNTVPASVTLAPGASQLIGIGVVVPAGADIGAVEETSLTAVEAGDIGASDTVSGLTTVVDTFYIHLPAISKP